MIRPYLPADVPPIRLGNSPRLRELVRAGKLYLTLQDAIALALENSIDIEIARYNPISLEWRLQRFQAGGSLPGVPSGASQAGTVASGQGVAGSQAAAGVSLTGGNGNGSNAGNATISQIGPVTQTLDPSIQETTTFSHNTAIYPNIVQTITPVLVSNSRAYSASLQEGFLSGGSVTLNYANHYLNENSPTDILNPSEAPVLSLSFQHNLLRGFGVAVNARNITVAKINLQTSDQNFRSQVIGVVAQVLNAYYAVVADYENLKARQDASQTAQVLFENNKRQVQLGALAENDLTTVESQVASTTLDLVVSQSSLQQDQLTLKNLISRTSVTDPVLAEADIVPLDRIDVPEKDDLPSFQQMIEQAYANRSDLAAQQTSVTTSEVSALGTANGLKPTLLVIGGRSQAGLAGVPRQAVGPNILPPNPYFVGGVSQGLGQVFRSNFPTERIGGVLIATLRNNQAQADYGIDQLNLRQSQLQTQKQRNQIGVDISNAVIAMQQARVRHDASVKSLGLAQELLTAEQKKFGLGASTPYNVIQQQRDLVVAQANEAASRVTYLNARTALDQALGTLLEQHHVSLAEAKSGMVSARPSSQEK